MESSSASHFSAASTAATTPVAVSSAKAREGLFCIGEELKPDVGDPALHMGKRRRSTSCTEEHKGGTARHDTELSGTGTRPPRCLDEEGFQGGKEGKVNDPQVGSPRHVQYGGLYRLYRLDARRLTLSGLRDARQVSQLAAFLHAVTEPEQLGSSSRPSAVSSRGSRRRPLSPDEDTAASSTGTSNPPHPDRSRSASSSSLLASGVAQGSGDPEEPTAANDPTVPTPLPLARGGPGGGGDNASSVAFHTTRQTMGESGGAREDARQHGGGKDHRCTNTGRSGASVYLDDASAEVVVAVLDQLRGFSRLEALQLHLWGVDWTDHMLHLLGEVLAGSASTLRSVALRCRVTASVLHGMLKLIPRGVLHLDISENMLGHCDSGTLVVPELERLLRENGLQSLKANQVGWSRDEAKKLLAEVISRLGVFNCLQWLEGLDLSEHLEIPAQTFMMASVPGPPCSSAAVTTSPLFHLYSQRLPSTTRGSDSSVTKSLLPTTINYTLLRFLRIRAFLPLLSGCRVRVWWKPTSESQRTDFSGRYWPARIIHGCPKTLVCKVVYDNNEEDFIPLRYLQPQHPFRYGGGWGRVVPADVLPCSCSSSSSTFPDIPPPLSSAALPSFLSASPASARLSEAATELPQRGRAGRENLALGLPRWSPGDRPERKKDGQCGDMRVKERSTTRNSRSSKKTESDEGSRATATLELSEKTGGSPPASVPLLFFSDDDDPRKGEPRREESPQREVAAVAAVLGASRVSGGDEARAAETKERGRRRRRPHPECTQGDSCCPEIMQSSPHRRTITASCNSEEAKGLGKSPAEPLSSKGQVKTLSARTRESSAPEVGAHRAPYPALLPHTKKAEALPREKESEAGAETPESSRSSSSRLWRRQGKGVASPRKKEVGEEASSEPQGKIAGRTCSRRGSNISKETENSVSGESREEETARGRGRSASSCSSSSSRRGAGHVKEAKCGEGRGRSGGGRRKKVTASSRLRLQTSVKAAKGATTDTSSQVGTERRGRRMKRSPSRTPALHSTSGGRPHVFKEDLRGQPRGDDGQRRCGTPKVSALFEASEDTVNDSRTTSQNPKLSPETPGSRNQRPRNREPRRGQRHSLQVKLPRESRADLSVSLPETSPPVASPGRTGGPVTGEQRVTRSMTQRARPTPSPRERRAREAHAWAGEHGAEGDSRASGTPAEVADEVKNDGSSSIASESKCDKPLNEGGRVGEESGVRNDLVVSSLPGDSADRKGDSVVYLGKQDVCCAPAPIREEDLPEVADLYPHLFEQYLSTNRLREREERRGLGWRRRKSAGGRGGGCRALPGSGVEGNLMSSRSSDRQVGAEEEDEAEGGTDRTEEPAEKAEDAEARAFFPYALRSKRGHLPDQELSGTPRGKRRLKEESEKERKRAAGARADEEAKTSEASPTARRFSRDKWPPGRHDHGAVLESPVPEAPVVKGGEQAKDDSRRMTGKKNSCGLGVPEEEQRPVSSSGLLDFSRASGVGGGKEAAEEEVVTSAVMPLDVIGNVLLPGEFCEFRDEEEHRGSDPSDFVGMVVGINPQEPLYVVRYVYHDDDTLLQVYSGDIRRAVVVPLDAWMAWRFALERFTLRQLERQQLPACVERGSKHSERKAAVPQRNSRPGKPHGVTKQSFPSFRDVPPFATFYMLPLATMARLKQLSSCANQDAGFQRNPVDFRLLPPEDFCSDFATRQDAFVAERCQLLEAFLNKEYPSFRLGSRVDAKPSEPVDGSSSDLPGHATGDPESTDTEQGVRETFSSRRLLIWKAYALVHPRMQDRDASAWLGLLPKEQLLSKVIQLSKDVAHLKSQLQREAGLSSECQRLRVALEAEKEKKEDVEGLLRCIICVARPRDVVLGPCLHFYVCVQCSRGLSQCPICRSKITSRIEVKREQGGQTTDDESP